MSLPNTLSLPAIEELSSLYNESGHINLPRFFEPDFAEKLTSSLEQHDGYKLATFINNQVLNLPFSHWQSLSQQEKQSMHQQIMHNASQGIGYLYGRSSLETAGTQTSLFQLLADWLNSAEVLAWARQITGLDDICAASLQASRFSPGHFLTRHKDHHASEQRRAAFVLNFNREWHPDWGGLLQFYSQDGLPQKAWTPVYNSMNLFDVDRVHSVTYVTPFARQPRFAFSGWFRATPL